MVGEMKNVNAMKWHPASCIFPMLDESGLQSLADDIRQHGQREPVVLFEGMVLDGRNRWMACKMAGIAPKTREFTGTRTAALAYVWSLNFERRHLNDSQSAICEAERKKLDSQYAAELEALKKEKAKRANVGKPSSQKIARTEWDNRSTASQRASAVGTNRTYIREADKIVSERPDLATKIKAGELTIPQARAEIKRDAKRKELDAAAERIKQHEHERPKWTILNVDVMLGLESVRDDWGPVRLIFADPPYNIGVDYGSGTKADSLSDSSYMAWVSRWIGLCVDCLADDGSMWVMIGDEYAAEYAIELKRTGLTIRSWIKWYEAFGVNCADKFNRSSRHIFYCVKDPKRFIFNPDAVSRPSDRQSKYGDKRANPSGKLWDDVWQIPRLTGTCDERIPGFPTQLPLGLVRPIVECASMPGDLVVDPFNGSGTTGVAAIEGKRKYVGIEMQESFVDLANKRLMLL